MLLFFAHRGLTADGLKMRRELSTFKFVDVEAGRPFYADRDSMRFVAMFILVYVAIGIDFLWL